MHAGKTADVSQNSTETASADQAVETPSPEVLDAKNIDVPEGLAEIDLPLDESDSLDSGGFKGEGTEPVLEEIDIEEIEAALEVDPEVDEDGAALAEPPVLRDDDALVLEAAEGEDDALILEVAAEADEVGEDVAEPESMAAGALVLEMTAEDGEGDGALAEPPESMEDDALVLEVVAEGDDDEKALAEPLTLLDEDALDLAMEAEPDAGEEGLAESPEMMDEDALVLDLAAEDDEGEEGLAEPPEMMEDDALVLEVEAEADDVEEDVAEPLESMDDEALVLELAAEADDVEEDMAEPPESMDDDALVLELAAEDDEGEEGLAEPPEMMDDNALVLELAAEADDAEGDVAGPSQSLDDDVPVLEMASDAGEESLVLELEEAAPPESMEETEEGAPATQMEGTPDAAGSEGPVPAAMDENDFVVDAGTLETESDDFDLEMTEEEIVEEAPLVAREAEAPDESFDLSFGIEIEPITRTGLLSRAPAGDGSLKSVHEDRPVAKTTAWGAPGPSKDEGPLWKRSVTLPAWWIAVMVAILGIGVGVMILGRTGSGPHSAVNVSVVSTDGRIINNIDQEAVFVVSGRVKNEAGGTRRRILVQGRIYTRNGFAKTVEAFAGHDLPEAELTAMPAATLLSRLADPPQAHGADVLLPAGETLPFTLVFTGLPQDLTALEKYTVAVIAAGS